MRTTTFSSTATMPSSRSLLLEAFTTALDIWSRRRTKMMLGDLDDHILRDIGVDPRDVKHPRSQMHDWVVEGRTGSARLVFIGR